MASQFSIGDHVRSLVNSQGLTEGCEYIVRDVLSKTYPWGTFITYMLAPAEECECTWLAVVNGHLVLRAEPQAEESARWSARCECYSNHNSASGRCNTRNVTDPHAKKGERVLCSRCRSTCGAAR